MQESQSASRSLSKEKARPAITSSSSGNALTPEDIVAQAADDLTAACVAAGISLLPDDSDDEEDEGNMRGNFEGQGGDGHRVQKGVGEHTSSSASAPLPPNRWCSTSSLARGSREVPGNASSSQDTDVTSSDLLPVDDEACAPKTTARSVSESSYISEDLPSFVSSSAAGSPAPAWPQDLHSHPSIVSSSVAGSPAPAWPQDLHSHPSIVSSSAAGSPAPAWLQDLDSQNGSPYHSPSPESSQRGSPLSSSTPAPIDDVPPYPSTPTRIRTLLARNHRQAAHLGKAQRGVLARGKLLTRLHARAKSQTRALRLVRQRIKWEKKLARQARERMARLRGKREKLIQAKARNRARVLEAERSMGATESEGEE